MAAEAIEIDIVVDSADAQRSLGAFSQQVTRSTANIDAALNRQRGSFNDVRQVVGSLGNAFGGLSPRIGQVVGALAGMTTAMGPLGIVIAAVTTGIGLLASSTDDAAESTDRLAESARRATASLSETITRMRELREQRELGGRVARGAGSIEEQEADLARRRAELDRLRGTTIQGRRIRGRGTADEIEAQESAVAFAEARLEQARAAGATRTQTPEEVAAAARERSGAGGGGRGGATRRGPRGLAGLTGRAGESADIGESSMRSVNDLMSEGVERGDDFADTIRDIAGELGKMATAGGEAKTEIEGLTEQQQEYADTAAKILSVTEAGITAAAEVFGAKERDKYLIKGTTETIEAIISAASYDYPAAALHGIAAAQAFAFAGKGGGGGAGAGGGRRGGGGGEPMRERGSGGGKPQTVVINYNHPVPLEQQGRMMDRARRESDRRFGGAR